jgi:hypothetical protein
MTWLLAVLTPVKPSTHPTQASVTVVALVTVAMVAPLIRFIR